MVDSRDIDGVARGRIKPLPLVGRAKELRQLELALRGARGGQGSAVFLAGEMGIGKTRLASEALDLATQQGFLTLRGTAYQLEGDISYAPLVSAFGGHLRRLDTYQRSRLVQALPDLGRLFPELGLPSPDLLGDPALEKTRLFEAVSRLMSRMASDKPVVLWLDDLHWADAATLEMLHYIGRALANERALLLGAYRPEEMNAARGLRALVSSLSRAGVGQEVKLAPLARRDTAEICRAVLGGEPPAGLLDLLERMAAGTPLLVTEIVSALQDRGSLSQVGGVWALDPGESSVVPANVRELLLERFGGLDKHALKLLDVLAAGGDTVGGAALKAASGLDDEEYYRSTTLLQVRGLVREEADGLEIRHGFTHPMVSEVAYERLTLLGRQRAHAALAGALDSDNPTGALLDGLGHQYAMAGPEAEAGRALDVLVAAGERAAGIHANDSAASLFGAALSLVRSGKVPEKRSRLLPWLLERLAYAWEQVGEGAAATSVAREALQIYQEQNDAVGQARVFAMLAKSEALAGRFDRALAHLDDGERVLGDGPSSPEWTNLRLARLSVQRWNGQVALDDSVLGDLPSLLARGASASMLGEAIFTEVGLLLASRRLTAAGERAAALLATADRSEDRALAMYARYGLTIVSLSLGDHASAYRRGGEALELARLLAPPHQALPRAFMALSDYLSGRWIDGLRLLTEGLALARRVGMPREKAALASIMAMLLAVRGDVVQADAYLHEAAEWMSEGQGGDRMQGGVEMAERFMEVHRHPRATLPVPRVIPLQERRGLPRTFEPTLAVSVLADERLGAGDAEGALEAAGWLRQMQAGASEYVLALAQRTEGLAHAMVGDDGAAAEIEQAAEAFERLEMPFEGARARMEWASLRGCERDEAAAALQAALATFESLGARLYARTARDALTSLGVRPPARKRERASDSPLSAREMEVASS